MNAAGWKKVRRWMIAGTAACVLGAPAWSRGEEFDDGERLPPVAEELLGADEEADAELNDPPPARLTRRPAAAFDFARVVEEAAEDDFAATDEGDSSASADEVEFDSGAEVDARVDSHVIQAAARGRVIRADETMFEGLEGDAAEYREEPQVRTATRRTVRDETPEMTTAFDEMLSAPVPPPDEASWDSGLCGESPAACSTCDTCCAPPYWRHQTSIWGEYLYLRPRNAEVPYAVPIDGPVAPVIGNGIQNGPTATVNPGYQSAFAVGGSWALSDFNSIRLRYAHFDQLTSDAASISPPDVLRALVTHPLGTNAATDTLDASASLNLRYNIADLVYAGVWWGGDNFVVNYFGGGRYLNFQQDFNALFSTIGTTPVDANITFDGGGIQLGLDAERRSCRTGLLVYGRASSSFVVGQFNASYRQADATGVAIAANSFEAGRIVPMLDLELGIGWAGPGGRWRFTAGYVVNAWFNTISTNDYIQAVQANNFNGMSNTITFDGLTVRGTLQF
ncbi:MAG: hypothetical protein JNG90_01325 [Planctomycetaceae bacterium]|nr:hypothetical protein [Planctomycetaceae bacterium]